MYCMNFYIVQNKATVEFRKACICKNLIIWKIRGEFFFHIPRNEAITKHSDDYKKNSRLKNKISSKRFNRNIATQNYACKIEG